MKYPQLVSMPSEISDWLEEQLEARGIDAVVYTRYILSLLRRDPVDVVCPDQDLHFTQPNKEVRRSGSGRKRFRCFSEWRDHAQADAEQLKRSAAIECLMSASDQNCGIESLVDELCEKLKEIKSDSAANTKSTASSNSTDFQSISPQDLARQYYAAFPPLTQHHRAPGTPNSIVTLIPKWFSSPKKKGARRQNRSASFDEKLHYKIDSDTMKSRSSGKQRLGYFSRSRNDLGYSRSMAKSVERSESMTDWDLFMFTNNTKNKLSNNSDNFGNIVEEKVSSSQNLNAIEKPSKVDENNRNAWNDEESMNICDDLPVDILELLDSPSPQDYTVEMMNLANMRDAGNKNFIHCGTNITSSIWSINAVIDDATVFDNTYNTALDAEQPETLLGMKFKSLSVGNKSIESIWSNPDIAENETNMLYESYSKSNMPNSLDEDCFENNGFSSNNIWSTSTGGMEKFEKWSEAEYFDNDQFIRNIAKSFLKLNHNRDESSFIEVIPRAGSNNFNFLNKSADMLGTVKKQISEKEEENLLTSMRSHFKPITSVANSSANHNQRRYADGTSFVISGNLDNPNYKRSDSGTQYLESDYGSPKKLLEYKNKMENCSTKPTLVLKFFICQNDKACQTDMVDELKDNDMDNPQEVPCKKRVMSEEPEDFFFPGDEEFLMDEPKQCNCTCPTNADKLAMNMDFSFGDDLATCPLHMTRPDSMLAEMWKGDSKRCDQCNSNSSSWNSNNWMKAGSTESVWKLDRESLRSIWNGGEVCPACLRLNDGGCPPLSSQQSQLREDISQDGEQLLSDLSTLQKSYMEQLPAAEISYDISELIAGTKERKRRHSPILEAAKNAVPVHRGSWSIASHIQPDQFMQVKATVPVLHSVTL